MIWIFALLLLMFGEPLIAFYLILCYLVVSS